ncbi:hypothetical protein I5M32_01080 [Pedobacter sp. SD-b]|uniref:Cytochrome c oxidase polypeptide IV n=1 Tax=Pedobacter segetis TaxID=2793069 RepID=A0ABS1BFA1_9SPHI|nr:hypothetical protein [Pedobacter segetis]MBK0381539.1 hypothetical protein [Pedobacter segetis]
MKEHHDQIEIEKGNFAKPKKLPKPTYWPFFFALGLTFLMWGIVTSWLISIAGFVVLVYSLFMWINILRNEARERN